MKAALLLGRQAASNVEVVSRWKMAPVKVSFSTRYSHAVPLSPAMFFSTLDSAMRLVKECILPFFIIFQISTSARGRTGAIRSRKNAKIQSGAMNADASPVTNGRTTSAPNSKVIKMLKEAKRVKISYPKLMTP